MCLKLDSNSNIFKYIFIVVVSHLLLVVINVLTEALICYSRKGEGIILKLK